MATQSTSAAADVVGIFDSSFTQLFPTARPLRAQVKEQAKVMEHPVESGATITDHRVILPVEIEMTLMVRGAEYRDTYNAIKERYLKTETLVIQTKTGSYPDMIISGMPHEEATDVFDAVPLFLQLRQVIFVSAQFQSLPPRQVAKKADASTVKRGEQTGRTEPTNGSGNQPSSILYGILHGGS